MASAAEQLAANINFAAFSKATELKTNMPKDAPEADRNRLTRVTAVLNRGP